MNIEFITELMRKREDRYKEVADVVVDTDGKSIQEIADEISQQVGL
jgi:shikimate kinase